MKDETIWAARRSANVRQGNRLLDDPGMQKSLLFQKHDNVIFDRAGELNLAYYLPSAVGSALFYYGHFEVGEVSLVARLLQDVREPTVLDIGANIGSHSLEWAHRLKSAQVYAFEPAPSNIELLKRNVNENHLSGRVHVVSEAVGAKPGSATFFETDDAAYSSLQDTMRRPVRAKYDVPVTTVDAFVERENLQTVTLVKIDVEGTEDAVIAGAVRTLERFKPLLFVEIYGGQHSNADPQHTIDALVGLGYVPHVISDGVLTPYEMHDDNFYNYLFVHESRQQALPPPDLLLKRALDAERLELLDKLTLDLEHAAADVSRAQRQWTELDRANREKDRKIQELSRAADDLVIQLQEKDRANQEITKASNDLRVQLKEKDALIGLLNESTAALNAQLQSMSGEIEAKQAALLGFDADMREKDALIARLSEEISNSSERLAAVYAELEEKQASLEPVYNEMELLRKAAKERLATANQLDAVAKEQLAAIVSLNDQLREKDALIARLSEEISNSSERLAAVYAELEEKQASLEPVYNEMELLRKAAEERLATANQLDAVAKEQLAAIVSLNDQLREKDALIARLNEEISNSSERLAALYAELEEKQALLEPVYNEMELLRKAAEERLATANQLDAVAQERLAVIVSLNAQLHELQGG